MIKKISLILAAFSCVLSTSALADTQVKKYYPMDSDNIKNLIPSIVDESVSDRSASYQNRARARGIYFFEVIGVASSSRGLENISSSTNTTSNDHGGPSLYVYVLQVGRLCNSKWYKTLPSFSETFVR